MASKESEKSDKKSWFSQHWKTMLYVSIAVLLVAGASIILTFAYLKLSGRISVPVAPPENETPVIPVVPGGSGTGAGTIGNGTPGGGGGTGGSGSGGSGTGGGGTGGAGNNGNNPPTGQCTDSDGGKNTAVKGTTTAKNGLIKTDYCIGLNTVMEFSCAADDSHEMTLTPCAVGSLCQDGACVVQQTEYSCTDADNGKNYYTKSHCSSSDKNISVLDSCFNGNIVNEQWCNNQNICEKVQYDCTTNASECWDGRCIKKNQDTDGDGASDLLEYKNNFDPNDPTSFPCVDSDNGAIPDVHGTCKAMMQNPQSKGDTCVDENILGEFTCPAATSVVCNVATYDCRNMNGFCLGGRCFTNNGDDDGDGVSNGDENDEGTNPDDPNSVPPQVTTCTDSDNGFNIFAAGTCGEVLGDTLSDVCEMGALKEANCNEDTGCYYEPERIYCSMLSLAYNCVGGACRVQTANECSSLCTGAGYSYGFCGNNACVSAIPQVTGTRIPNMEGDAYCTSTIGDPYKSCCCTN